MSLGTLQGSFVMVDGTADQVITLSDATFTPTCAFFWGVATVLNSGPLHYGVGFDDGTTPLGVAVNSGDFLGANENSETAWSDANSLITVRNSAANQINALGYVKSFSAGSMTIGWRQHSSNWSTGSIWNYLLFNGAGITAVPVQIVMPTTPQVVTHTLCTDPVALICARSGSTSATLSGSGGWMTFGVAANCNTKQAHAAGVMNAVSDPSVDKGIQRTDTAFLSTTSSAVNIRGTITAWTSTGITVDWTTVLGTPNNYYAGLAIGGACAANFGTITQPTSPETDRYTYTIADPKALIVGSANRAASTSVTANALLSIGVAASVASQNGVAFADMDGQSTPYQLSEADTGSGLRLYLAQHATGAGTGANDAGAILQDLSTGSMGWNWDIADTTPRELFYLVLGADSSQGVCGGTAPVVTTTYATRRVRRFSLPNKQNIFLYLSRLEVLMQQGVGLSTGQGSAPIVMLRISRDGGSTWGYEIQMSVGALGQYDFRTYVNRLGRGRNFVVELACSDPVFFAFLDCYVDLNEGTS